MQDFPGEPVTSDESPSTVSTLLDPLEEETGQHHDAVVQVHEEEDFEEDDDDEEIQSSVPTSQYATANSSLSSPTPLNG